MSSGLDVPTGVLGELVDPWGPREPAFCAALDFLRRTAMGIHVPLILQGSCQVG